MEDVHELVAEILWVAMRRCWYAGSVYRILADMWDEFCPLPF